ncbi:MAG: hypothetical protein ABIP45_14145 [Knoellia sp.]
MTLRQAPVIDVLTRGGETAVIVTSTLEVVRLGELGSMLYGLCSSHSNVMTLAAELERVFGPPAGMSSLDATQSAVADMVSAGVLEQALD